MRLATVRHAAGTRVVVDAGDNEMAALPSEIVDVGSLLGLLDEQREELVRNALAAGDRYAAADLGWLPPVLRPGKVLCVALNHSSNPDRIMSGPSTPAMFIKPSSALVGHGHAIRLRPDDGRVHPEPELAVIIGRRAADVRADHAMQYVFGYSILNDITAPDLRAADTFHYRAVHPQPGTAHGVRHVESWVSYSARYKGADTFAPLGPWVVTRDDIPDPHALRVTCAVDGEIVTDDTTAHLRFSVAEVISFASHYLTLEPGDVIGMGTALAPAPSGQAVQNADLNHSGARVEISIAGIGTLTNTVEQLAAQR